MPRMPLYPSLPSSLEVVASMVNAPEAIAWIFISNGSFRPHASQGRALVPAANLAVVCLLRAVLYLVRRCKDWPVPISCPLETKFNPVAKTCAKRKSFKLQYLLPTCIQLIKGLIAAQDIGFGWAVNGTFANKPCRLLISEAMRERKKNKKVKNRREANDGKTIIPSEFFTALGDESHYFLAEAPFSGRNCSRSILGTKPSAGTPVRLVAGGDSTARHTMSPLPLPYGSIRSKQGRDP